MLEVKLRFKDNMLTGRALTQYVGASFSNTGLVIDTQMDEEIWEQISDDPTIHVFYYPGTNKDVILFKHEVEKDGSTVLEDLMMYNILTYEIVNI